VQFTEVKSNEFVFMRSYRTKSFKIFCKASSQYLIQMFWLDDSRLEQDNEVASPLLRLDRSINWWRD